MQKQHNNSITEKAETQKMVCYANIIGLSKYESFVELALSRETIFMDYSIIPIRHVEFPH